MSEDFFIPEERIITLRATPSGRRGDGGYNYQRAFAVARLAAMRTAQPMLGFSDYPTRLRYDWADDLDELLGNSLVCFTQCKRVDDIGAPAKLAEVLAGFAPKLLWTPEAKRPQVRFRLVSCDPRFLHDYKKAIERSLVLANFKSQLAGAPSPQSDRTKWQAEANSIGHERLFDALWQPLDLVYLPKAVVSNDPVGGLLPVERAALDHLMKWEVIGVDSQKDALIRLRRLLHENLITFDPTDQTEPALPARSPHILNIADVRVALFAKEKDAKAPPFAVVDRIHLANARTVERKHFLFEPPEWHHVVHGADEKLRFVERDQTAALAQDVREKLIAPLLRGTGSLCALFVTGPPAAGKSTIVRRVAAQLIEAGEVVVADAGHNLDITVPGGVEPYLQQLIKLARQGRPVLLVLDDPLKAESEWIELIKHLRQPGLQLAVITPTPDFLYHSHQYELRGVQIHTFPVNPPSAAERQALALLYGRSLNENETLPDDFLVMVAEVAEGKPFSEIMQRLWTTLNDGPGISGDVPFKDLPWAVRAFWFVCALHRTYTPCPLSVLQAALEISGGTERLDVPTALVKLKAEGGWNIFRMLQPASPLFRSIGELVSTAHQKIASVAWEMRPGAWLDVEVNRLLAAATLLAPESVYHVAAAAGILTRAESNPDSNLADELMQQWVEGATKDQNLETRHLCRLTASLKVSGGRELAQRMSSSLGQRANGYHGWLAALELRYLSADKEPDRSFPRTINLSTLIAEADFSIAPNRASQFFKAAKEKQYREAIISRLCASLDGALAWQINSTLLVWLVSHAPQSQMIGRLGLLQQWLNKHADDTTMWSQYLAFVAKLPAEFAKQRKQAALDTAKWLADSRHQDDTTVRTQFLAFLMRLPAEFAEQRKQAALDTAKWLADSRHQDDTTVRTQFLAFLMKLPAEFAEQRQDAATATERWLAAHYDDTSVRTQYLAFLMKLPAEFAEQRQNAASATECWLEAHEDDTSVRTQYLAFLMRLPAEFAKQRKQVALDTAKWLADSRHQDDTNVRTQFLAFVMKLPAEFAEQRQNAATATERWLAAHYDDTSVRTQYLAFLMRLPTEFAEQRKQAALDTAKWLADSRHEDNTTVRTQFLAFVMKLPAEFAEQRNQVAFDTRNWLKKHPGNFDVCMGYVSFLLAVRHPDLATLEAESIPYHQSIIAKHPHTVGYRFTFGEQLLRLEKYAEAKAEYEQVLERAPHHQLAHRGLAVALQNLGETKKAEDAFKSALYWATKKGGKLAIFHTSLGRFYLEDQRWLEAISSLTAAADEDPEYYGNHLAIAKAQSGLGKLTTAKQSLKRALAAPGLGSPAKEEIEQMLADISQRMTAGPMVKSRAAAIDSGAE